MASYTINSTDLETIDTVKGPWSPGNNYIYWGVPMQRTVLHHAGDVVDMTAQDPNRVTYWLSIGAIH